MRTLLVSLAIVLSGCVHSMKPDQFFGLYAPTVVWSGPDVVECTYVTSSRGPHLDSIGVVLTVDGHEGLFQVDTGAGKTLIRPEYARRIGAKISEQQLYLTGGGSKRWQNVVFVDRLDFGFAQIEKTYVLAADLLQERNDRVPPEDQFEGILGLDLLTALGGEIDVPNHKIRFRRPPNKSVVPTPGSVLPDRGAPGSGAAHL